MKIFIIGILFLMSSAVFSQKNTTLKSTKHSSNLVQNTSVDSVATGNVASSKMKLKTTSSTVVVSDSLASPINGNERLMRINNKQ